MDADAIGICVLLVGRPKIEDDIGLLLELTIEFVISRTAIEQSHTQHFFLAPGHNLHVKGARIWLTDVDTPPGITQRTNQVVHALVCQMGLAQGDTIIRWHRGDELAMRLIVLLLHKL